MKAGSCCSRSSSARPRSAPPSAPTGHTRTSRGSVSPASRSKEPARRCSSSAESRSDLRLPHSRDHELDRRFDVRIYARARHPVYGGLLLAGIGLSLHRSALVLAPTAILAIVFWLKSIREEAWLVERYPDYPAYRQTTAHRFIPWII